MEQVATVHGVHEVDRVEAAKMGVWIFLFSEILLFGALFATYAVFRGIMFESFYKDHLKLDVTLGAINTVILLASSFTVAMAVASIQRGKQRPLKIYLSLTILMGLLFLVNKYFEYSAKISAGIVLGSSPFFSLYYFMTGLHGLHVLGGVVALSIALLLAARGRFSSRNYAIVEGVALYWHLVDIVWIYLFPMLYLV